MLRNSLTHEITAPPHPGRLRIRQSNKRASRPKPAVLALWPAECCWHGNEYILLDLGHARPV